MSAIDDLSVALFGSPPSDATKPDRSGVLAAFTELYAVAIASVNGITQATTAASLVAPTEGQPTVAIVTADSTLANNGYWLYPIGGPWTIATALNSSLKGTPGTMAPATNSQIDIGTDNTTSITPFSLSYIGVLTLPAIAESIRAPLWPDGSGKFAGSLDNGQLEIAKGLGPRTMALASSALAASFSPRNAPSSSVVPAHTDGRSLAQWRAKLANYKSAGTGKAKVMFLGDSWGEKTSIPQALATMLYASAAQAGGGYISIESNVATFTPLDGATFSTTGTWTAYQGGAGSTINTPPAIGTGIDGHTIYTTTAGPTATFGFTGTELHLYYGKGTGSFRYQVDGGAWTTVTPDGSNTLGILSLTGLSGGAHSFVVDTSVNTGGGTVGLDGLYFTTTAGVGVEVLKCGDAGMDSAQWTAYLSSASFAACLADMAPDVIIVPLGTNDYRRAESPPSRYIQTLSAFATIARATLPNVALIFIAPADTNGTAVFPLTAYRDALGQFCVANGLEFYNMHDEWSSYAVENALGQFADTLHVSNSGAYRVAARLKSRFLDL